MSHELGSIGNMCAVIETAAPLTGVGTVADPLRVLTGAWAGTGTVDTCGQLLSLDSSGRLRQREEKGSVMTGLVGAQATLVGAPTVAVGSVVPGIPLPTVATNVLTNPYCGPMNYKPEFFDSSSSIVSSSASGGNQVSLQVAYEDSLNGAPFALHGLNTLLAIDSQLTHQTVGRTRVYKVSVLAGGATNTMQSRVPAGGVTAVGAGPGNLFVSGLSLNPFLSAMAVSQ